MTVQDVAAASGWVSRIVARRPPQRGLDDLEARLRSVAAEAGCGSTQRSVASRKAEPHERGELADGRPAVHDRSYRARRRWLAIRA